MIPAHVPPELVVDFDYRAVSGSGDHLFNVLKDLHRHPEIFWSPRYQGHWVITRGATMRDILTNHRAFSSQSIMIPRRYGTRYLPLESDPPEHKGFRQIANSFLTRENVERGVENARRRARRIIENLRGRGYCEFVSEFAQQIPLQVFLQMCNMEPEEHGVLFELYDRTSFSKMGEVEEHFRRLVGERRRNFRDDFVGRLVQAEIDGRRLTDDECVGLCLGIILGAQETVTINIGWIMRYLALNPGPRAELARDFSLIPNAINELIRRFSSPNIARIVREDIRYNGVQMKAGDPVMMLTCLHGMDEKSFSDPLAVDFRRKDAAQNSAFSRGIHSCPGYLLAMGEMQVFLEEWLTFIPDFEPDGEALSGINGIVYLLFNLPLRWTR